MQQEQSHSLSEFASGSAAHIARLKRSGRPETLTVNGEEAIVVQDAGAYQRLLDRVDALEAIGSVKESVAEYGRNEGLTLDDGMAALRKKHGIPSND